MQAIVTKYLGPTNHKQARVVAKCWAGTVTVEYDSDLGDEGAHREAVAALADKLGWGGEMVQGQLPDGMGYAFVFIKRDDSMPLGIAGTL